MPWCPNHQQGLGWLALNNQTLEPDHVGCSLTSEPHEPCPGTEGQSPPLGEIREGTQHGTCHSPLHLPYQQAMSKGQREETPHWPLEPGQPTSSSTTVSNSTRLLSSLSSFPVFRHLICRTALSVQHASIGKWANCASCNQG